MIVVWVLIGYACWDILKTILLNQYNKTKQEKEEKEGK